MAEPEPLSTEYHKAHKQLMFWATILFIWELVGVNLDKAKDAGGNIGPVITAIKSPQAVPWVLLILVLYFLFKCSIEWAQCHLDRRKVRFARIDFLLAWIVSVAAIALYIGQTISRVQFADVVQSTDKPRAIASGLILGAGFGIIGLWYVDRKRKVLHLKLSGRQVIFVAVLVGLNILYTVLASTVLKHPFDLIS